MNMLIGKQECPAEDGRTIEVYNPATGELIDTWPFLFELQIFSISDRELIMRAWLIQSLIISFSNIPGGIVQFWYNPI